MDRNQINKPKVKQFDIKSMNITCLNSNNIRIKWDQSNIIGIIDDNTERIYIFNNK
jgi:hypothetical protein